MTPDDSQFQKLLESSLKFTWIEGAVNLVPCGYTVGPRVLPFAVATQIMGGDGEFCQTAKRPQRYHDGQAVIVPAKIPHRFTIIGPGECSSRWAHFNITLFDSIDVLHLINAPCILSKEAGHQVGELCQSLAEINNGQPGIAAACRRQQLGFQLLECIIQVSQPKENLRDLLNGLLRIAPSLRFLQEHFADNLTREDLARPVNLSPTRFHVVFKKIMGISPMHYVQQFRVSKAQELLRQTSLGVAEIAFKVGFSDPFYFSRIFKIRTGESPMGYRLTYRHCLPFA